MRDSRTVILLGVLIVVLGTGVVDIVGLKPSVLVQI